VGIRISILVVARERANKRKSAFSPHHLLPTVGRHSSGEGRALRLDLIEINYKESLGEG